MNEITVFDIADILSISDIYNGGFPNRFGCLFRLLTSHHRLLHLIYSFLFQSSSSLISSSVPRRRDGEAATEEVLDGIFDKKLFVDVIML